MSKINNDFISSQDYGTIEVKLHKGEYYQEETVQGKIYLNLK